MKSHLTNVTCEKMGTGTSAKSKEPVPIFSHAFGRRAAIAFLLALLAPLLPIGCSDSQSASSAATPLPERETWDVLMIQGSRVGYGRTAVSHTTENGRKLVRIEGLQHITVQRFGQQATQEFRVASLETPDGKLVEFSTEIGPSAVPQRTFGRVVGAKLELETTTQGKKIASSIPWPADYGGVLAVERSLWHEPLQPGGRRTVRALDPSVTQVVDHEMTARDYEPTKLLEGTQNLLRIDAVTRLPDGNALSMIYWCDRKGDILKQRQAGMNVEAYRTTKAEALKKAEPGGFDLFWNLSVKVDRPLPKPFDSSPHGTRQIRYRVTLKDDDPAKAFASGASQRVKSIDAHTAEVTVYAIRPGQKGGNPAAPNDPPTDADRQSNNLIQSDDRKIVALAQQAAGETKDPWEVAQGLEQFVHRYITTISFSQAFATAAEVAAKPVGDCKAHAMLLAALCRARGIPARVVIGLVYMSETRSFAYHMWTEAHIDKRWIPLDATLGRGGIGAAHLKVVHSSLQGASAYSSFLPVMKVAGSLKIEILDVE